MKELKKVLYAAYIFLACIATTPVIAGSSEFTGIYGALQGSAAGVELQGTYTDENGRNTRGSGGRFVPLAGAELGFSIPIGKTFFISVGGVHNFGSAEVLEADDFDNNADISLALSDHKTYYIMPSISVWENSAVYVKYGKSSADLTATGDATPTAGQDGLDGHTIAIGTTSMFGSGIFIRTEVGATEYDEIKYTDIGGTSSDGGTNTVVASPKLAYGNVSIGFKF